MFDRIGDYNYDFLQKRIISTTTMKLGYHGNNNIYYT